VDYKPEDYKKQYYRTNKSTSKIPYLWKNFIHPHEKTIVPDICPVIHFDFTVNNMDKDWQTTYRVTY